MRNQEVNLSQFQQRFLKDFLAQAGKEAIGIKINLVDSGKERYLEWEQNTIPLTLKDRDLLDLAGRGYLKIYANNTPVSIVFTKLVQEHFAEKDAPKESNKEVMSNSVVRMDIVQVYAWLVASLLAAIFFLFLLWLTVQQALQQHISVSVATAIIDLIPGSLSAVFFKQYNNANKNLSHLRSGLPDIKNQETDK